MTEKLTIIMPVFNGGKFLRPALESLLQERRKLGGMEIIVVDDGSTDDAVTALADYPIRIIRHDKNLGIAAAQNRGLREATGDIIGFFDQDDFLCPDGIRWRWEWLTQNPNRLSIGGLIAGIVDGNSQYLGPVEDFYPGLNLPPFTLDMNFFRQGNEFSTAMWLYLFRRKLIESIGYFDQSLKVGTDREYLFRILNQVDIPIRNRPVLFRRLHESNLSGVLAKRGFAISRRAKAEGYLVNLEFQVMS